jgi:hypothetical protein
MVEIFVIVTSLIVLLWPIYALICFSTIKREKIMDQIKEYLKNN